MLLLNDVDLGIYIRANCGEDSLGSLLGLHAFGRGDAVRPYLQVERNHSDIPKKLKARLYGQPALAGIPHPTHLDLASLLNATGYILRGIWRSVAPSHDPDEQNQSAEGGKAGFNGFLTC